MQKPKILVLIEKPRVALELKSDKRSSSTKEEKKEQLNHI
jgi:hypothetical protein